MRSAHVLLLFIASIVIACGACTAKKAEPGQVETNSLPQPISLETANWSEPYSGPQGFPKGAQRATVSTDPATGGETYYARFPKGTKFDMHWHAHSEYAVVLGGTVTHLIANEKHVLGVGDYVVVPAKVPHGWEVGPSEDALLLIRRDGPADFNFVQTRSDTHPRSSRSRFSSPFCFCQTLG